MKTQLLITIILLCIIHYSSQAQTDSLWKRQKYNAWIKTYDAPGFSSGVLYETKDSSILLSKERFFGEDSQVNSDILKINTGLIDVIKIRKKGNTGLGILIGAMTGLVIGGVVDLIYYLSWKNEEPKKANNFGDGLANAVERDPKIFTIKASIIGIAFIGTGIGIGTAIGSARITIPINGNQEQFNQNKSTLNDYSIKQNPGLTGVNTGTFIKLRDIIVDIDSNIYHTIALGGQVWMSENLKATRFRDGSEIPGITKNITESGRQYSWVTINDSRKLCPAGWNVPSLAEWTSLFNSLGGENGADSKLDESFSTKGQECHWWTSTEQDTDHAHSFYLNNKTIGVMITTTAKTSGLSVRCIRDY